jgi:hypothetical protein
MLEHQALQLQLGLTPLMLAIPPSVSNIGENK